MDLVAMQRRLDWQQSSTGLMLCLSGFLVLGSTPGWASEALPEATGAETAALTPGAETVDVTAIPRLSEQNQPATTVEEWTTQMAQARVTITGVRVEETEAGLQVVLETDAGDLPAPNTQTVGNALIAEIPNAVLDLPEGEPFEQFGPAEGIALLSVTNQPDGSVRVSITGTDAPPQAQVSTETGNLVLSVVPGVAATADADEDAIQVVVTGEQDEGYAPSSASTATRTDTPLRDIPQSIQVVPQEVIEDQGVTRIGDALRNVSGVTPERDFGNISDRFNIRGFRDSRILRNGFRSGLQNAGFTAAIIAPSTVERIEVLKGPASVLYGQVEPGGVVNFITEQPSRNPFYDFGFTAGSFGYIEPSLDFSGPLTADERLTYRLNASYQNGGNFRDFVDSGTLAIAPVIRYDFSNATSLTFEYGYLESNKTFDEGLLINPVVFELPRERFLGETNDFIDTTTHSFYLTLDHSFNENIKLRSSLSAEITDSSLNSFRNVNFDSESNQLTRTFADRETFGSNYSWQTDLTGEFKTGFIEHQLLAGFELAWTDFGTNNTDVFDPENRPFAINVLNPQYGTLTPSLDERNAFFTRDNTDRIVGLYLQDQVTLLPNLKFLVGGRYDFARNEGEFSGIFNDEPFSGESEFDSEAFSPRVGIVYQPVEPISLYASYSRSFIPNSVTTVDGDVIEPERGTQYEVGVRGEFGDVIVNLAAYDITKTNLTRTDPNNISFSIPVGEVRSRGIELDVAGEITNGWNIIGSLFFNDAFISEGDEFNPEGDTLINAPGSGASLWTTYEIQTGNLQGLGFGVGLFYVGDREAEIPNDFVLPSYVRADASLFYNRDNWRVQLNFKNLFDTRYLESTQNSGTVFPGAPFTVLGTISVSF